MGIVTRGECGYDYYCGVVQICVGTCFPHHIVWLYNTTPHRLQHHTHSPHQHGSQRPPRSHPTRARRDPRGGPPTGPRLPPARSGTLSWRGHVVDVCGSQAYGGKTTSSVTPCAVDPCWHAARIPQGVYGCVYLCVWVCVLCWVCVLSLDVCIVGSVTHMSIAIIHFSPPSSYN